MIDSLMPIIRMGMHRLHALSGFTGGIMRLQQQVRRGRLTLQAQRR